MLSFTLSIVPSCRVVLFDHFRHGGQTHGYGLVLGPIGLLLQWDRIERNHP